MSSTRVRFKNRTANQLPYLAGLLLISILSFGLSGCSGVVSGNSGSSNSSNPLTITSVQAGAPTTTGFQVSWTTSAAANSSIEYGKTSSYGSTTPLDAALVTNHQKAVANLTIGTLYHFRVHSTDVNSNSAVSGDMTFATAGDTVAPTVSITSPAANATLSGTVNVAVTASDNVGVANVQLKVDNANSGAAVTAAPFVISLNTTSLSNGNHILTAVATDAAGNSTTSAGVAVSVNNTTPDTTPPTVSITAPANAATVSGTVSVTATASDNVGVASVQFQLDGANLGSLDTASPYSTSWNTTTSSNGSHTLRAIAKDAAGNSTTSAGVTVTVSNSTPDTTPPTVSVTAPAGGSTVSGTVSVTATASDNVGVASVQFQLDGANLGSLDTASPYSTSWNTTTSSNGSHTLRAIAKDAAGNSTTSASVTVTVSNSAPDTTPPSVPTGLTATAVSSSQINLAWTASTDNVGVTGYKVFRGGTQIGTSTTTVFSDSGLTASTTYSYTVAAFDAAGNTSAQSASASATTLASSGGGIPSTLGWYQIPNTSIQALCPPYSDIQGMTGCAAVMSAWNGGLFDTKRNRLIIHGGGHTDYFGNEIYAIDLNANPIVPILVKDASHGTAISNLSTCPEAYSDGTPSSRHSYAGQLYLPTQDKYMTFSGSKSNCGFFSSGLWYFDPAGLSWTQQAVSGSAPNPGQNGSTPEIAYDPTTGSVYEVEANAAIFWKYNPGTKVWTNLANASVCGLLDMSAAIDDGRRLYFCIGNGGFTKISLNSPFTSVNLAGTGCSALVSKDGPGFVYDPVQKLMVGWAGGNTVYLYNPDTDSCSTVTYSGGPTTIQPNGTFGRFAYSTALNVFVVANDISQNAYTLRLTSGSGTGGSSGPAISNVGASSITTSGAINSWTTDVGATSQVEYGTTTAYGSMTAMNSSLVTSHSVALTGLSVGTLYHYRVRSKNSSGVESISGDFAFSTNSTSDTTPPTVSITSPAAGATVLGPVNITATATDNVGVTSVQFLLDGSNLGSIVTASPYTISWDTTTATNALHTLTAQARDAAGNVGTSLGISVTVSNTVSTALLDFQTRCSSPGVIVCQGFDSASVLTPAQWPNSGIYPDDNKTFINTTFDATVSVSGGGSIKFTIPSKADGNTGYWRQLFNSNLSAGPTQAQVFGQNSTFYVQFRQRFSPEFLTNTWPAVGGGTTYWKQEIFSNDLATCANEELTTINAYMDGFPQMYSQCGQDPFQPSIGTGDFLLEQGDTSTTGYNCHFLNKNPTDCFYYPSNTWVTFYYQVSIGNWGQPNSTIKAWVALPGQPYKEWINMPNHVLVQDTGAPGYDMVTLLPYMTGRDPNVSAGPTAFTWYDELIVSANPIAVPKF